METKDYWYKNIFYHYGVGYIVAKSLQTLIYKQDPSLEQGSKPLSATTECLNGESKGIVPKNKKGV